MIWRMAWCWASGHGKEIFKGKDNYSQLCEQTGNTLKKLLEITLDLMSLAKDEGISLSEIEAPYPKELYNKIEQRTIAFCVFRYLIEKDLAIYNIESMRFFPK